MKQLILPVLLLSALASAAQQIKVESDKTIDLSRYKTFRFGEGQITTPKDKRVTADATVHSWIRSAVSEELTEKGLTKADTADIVVSYLIGSEEKTYANRVGPLGQTPGSNDETFSHDYQQGSLIIDLNDTRNNKLIWRVSAVTSTNQQEGNKGIDEIVEKGFKKFSIKSKHKEAKHKK